MFLSRSKFELGDTVRVNDGVRDEDSGLDMSGWYGRVSEIDLKHKMLLIDFDSVTLRSLPADHIEQSEVAGLGWPQYNIGFDSVTKVEPRDTKADVEAALDDLHAKYAWSFLGEEGREINAILGGVDPDNDWACFEAWEAHLRKVLRFPFKAEVAEWQEYGPLRAVNRVKVLDIEDIADPYGVLVIIKHRRTSYTLPLCDLEVIDKRSPNRDPVQLYSLWFANR